MTVRVIKKVVKKKRYIVNLSMSLKKLQVCDRHIKVTGIRLNAY